jgi:hypothetical protein
MSTYNDRYQEQLAEVRRISDARQRFLDMVYARMEAEEAARQQEAAQAESSGKLNWFDNAFSGARTGATIGAAGGPVGAAWGALAGGIVGTAGGMREAYGERRKRGDGMFSAFGSTVGDTPFGVNPGAATMGAWGKGKFLDRGAFTSDSYGNLFGSGGEDAIGTGGAIYGAHAKEQARTSTAKDRQKEELARREFEIEKARILAGRDQRPVNDQNTGFNVEGAYGYREPGYLDR